MPGETVVPASATRIGWKTSFGLRAARLDDLAQRRLDRLDVERLDVRQRLARLRERCAAVVVEPLLARRRVVGRPVEDEAGQRPEVGQRLDLLLGDRDRVAQPGAAGEAPRARAVSSSTRQLAQVAAVHPAQLLLVEARRVALHARDVECATSSSVERIVSSSAAPQPSSAR